MGFLVCWSVGLSPDLPPVSLHKFISFQMVAFSPGVVADCDQANARRSMHDRFKPSVVIHHGRRTEYVEKQLADAADESEGGRTSDLTPGWSKNRVVCLAFGKGIHRDEPAAIAIVGNIPHYR